MLSDERIECVLLSQSVVIIAIHIRFAEPVVVIFLPQSPTNAPKSVNGRAQIGWQKCGDFSSKA